MSVYDPAAFVAVFADTDVVSFTVTNPSFDVDWGDGTFETYNNPLSENLGHRYAKSGTWVVQIVGTTHRICGLNTPVVEVAQWGRLGLVSTAGMFNACSRLVTVPNSTDGLEAVTDMQGMFAGASAFNRPLDRWDTSAVTNLHGMFAGAGAFDQPLDSWDVSQVRNLARVFCGASSFNRPLGTWDVSAATNMYCMFSDAAKFFQDLSAWDVHHNVTVEGMFDGTAMAGRMLPDLVRKGTLDSSEWYDVEDVELLPELPHKN